jgi:hypothetical protein
MHIDHAKAIFGIFAGDGDRVRVSDHTGMLGCGTIYLGKSQDAAEIVGRQSIGLVCYLWHLISSSWFQLIVRMNHPRKCIAKESP